MRTLAAALLLLAAAPVAAAENRPDEDALFGAPASEPAAPGTPALPTEPSRPAEEAIFGETPAPEAQPAAAKPTRPDEGNIFSGETHLSEDAAPEDPLKIGGQFYMRAAATGYQDTPPSEWQLTAPTLIDAYFDARPNDRVRGFLLGRLYYNPSAGPDALGPGGLPAPGESLQVALDQLWLRFDLGRAVFVTAGRQHVKWGPARFWNPTDFLHQVRRDPLAVFDERVGTTMVKLHVPWEKRGWNFYGVGLLEDTDPADTVSHVGAALRAEVVFGPAEFGASAIAQRGRRPRFGLDVSSGLGPIDFYAEAALKTATDTTLYRLNDVGGMPVPEAYTAEGTAVGLTAGANWTFMYSDEDSLTLGAEYFYNSLGYDDAKLYPVLMALGNFNPFYVGRQYAGLYALLMNPGSWNNSTFTLSGLGSLSDSSYIARLDYSVLILTHLRVEAYGAAHFGQRGGVFRFSVDTTPIHEVIPEIPATTVPPPTVEAGVGLRINI